MRASLSMRDPRLRGKSGFSIVEAVIAMAIVLILTSIGIASCNIALKLQNYAIHAENVYNVADECVDAYLLALQRYDEAQNDAGTGEGETETTETDLIVLYNQALQFALGENHDFITGYGVPCEYEVTGGTVKIILQENNLFVTGKVRGLWRNVYEYDHKSDARGGNV